MKQFCHKEEIKKFEKARQLRLEKAHPDLSETELSELDNYSLTVFVRRYIQDQISKQFYAGLRLMDASTRTKPAQLAAV